MTYKSDRWLWIVLSVGLTVRLIEIDAPLIDHQAWRQTDTAAIARNFFQEEFNIFYPRIDWRGTTPGYVETNFPLFPFLVACGYQVINSPQEWIGRLFSALFSTISAFFLYCLATRLFNNFWIARFSSVLFLAFPINVYFGRTFMPEALMLLLSIGTLLTFLRWTETEKLRDFALATVTAGLCYAVKIPTLYLGFPLVAIAWVRWGWPFLTKPILWVYLFCSLMPSLSWYLHAASLFEETGLTFGIWNRYGYNKWAHDLLFTPDFYITICGRMAHRVFTPFGLALVLLGVFMRWPRKNTIPDNGFLARAQRCEAMLYAWAGGLILYLLVVPEGNRGLHYYQLPFVPVGAIFASIPLAAALTSSLKGSHPAIVKLLRPGSSSLWGIIGIFLGVILYGAVTLPDYYRPGQNIYNYYRSALLAGQILDRKLPEKALIVVGDIDESSDASFRAQSPTMLYYCNRKGWQILPGELEPEKLDSLSLQGADFFVAGHAYAAADSSFYSYLTRRGLSFPSAYPTRWNAAAAYLRAARDHSGLDRHFVVVPL